MADKRQSANAIRFYEAKSADYDGTWHDDFTTRFVSYLDIREGQNVLDLACGTGLLTFLLADKVGKSGSVVGVDVTPGMLAVAGQKKELGGDKYANMSLYQADVLHLDEIEALKGKRFDAITVASALVLFPDPKAAIEHWSTYLKPGGILAVDATHPRNLISGIVLERVARRLDLPIPYNRSWSQSESTLQAMLESAGLEVESVFAVDNQAGYGRRFHDIDKWDDFFVETVIVKDVMRTFASNDIRRKAQGIYKEEWEKLAVDGKVEEVDAVFLGIARKPADGTGYVPKANINSIVFKGGCRCGSVKYTSTEPPSDITLCHCRACQHLSGSAYLPFISVPKSALKYADSSTLKSLKLSEVAERTFCASCGTPITMGYTFKDGSISVTVGSIDMASLTCQTPKARMHIFLNEKAPWFIQPEDGAERWGTSEFAHLLEFKKD